MMLLDLGVAILLVLTIGFCVRLNRKIVELHRGKGELSRLFKQFETIIFRAEQSINELKTQSAESSENLANSISQSRVLAEHLGALLNKANKTHSGLEAMLQKGKLLIDEFDSTQGQLQQNLQKIQEVNNRANSQQQTRQYAPPYYNPLPRQTAAPQQSRGPQLSFQDSKPTPLEKVNDPAVKKIAIETLLERIANANSTSS